jgi:hypothetical protein
MPQSEKHTENLIESKDCCKMQNAKFKILFEQQCRILGVAKSA